MSRDMKADLTLMHKLVAELEKQLDDSYKLRDTIKETKDQETYFKYVIEISKAVGILSGISQEASLLIGDMQKLIQIASQPNDMEDPTSMLQSILSPLGKGKGGGRN